MSKPESTGMKRCPFCGGVAARGEADDGGGFIHCTRCDASTALHYDRRENLLSSWNDRAGVVGAEDLLSLVQRFVALPSGAWHPERHAAEEAELMSEARALLARAEP